MVIELKLQKVGNALGVILPKQALERLKASAGDKLYMTESRNGGLRIMANSPDFLKTTKVMESVSRRYRNALRKLAD
jgi:putative addiction module antidote